MNAENADTCAFTPDPLDKPCRLDVFLSRKLEGCISREKIKKAIARGKVRLNLQPCALPKTLVEYGDSVEIDLSAINAQVAAPAAEKLPLEIIYRDADIAVINKAAGLTVHPCPSCPEGTLVNRLVAHFPELSGLTGAGLSGPERAEGAAGRVFVPQGERPGIVHRLDKDTTGLLLVALNEASRLKLAAAFAAREVKKEYLALVYGVPEPAEGSVSAPLGRDASRRTRMAVSPASGRAALSEYSTLYADPAGRFSLLSVRIHTGRTHQIRVHLRHIGHPVLGDSVYFTPRAACEGMRAYVEQVAPRPLLHAWKIAFVHPAVASHHEAEDSGPAEETPGRKTHEKPAFCCPPPRDFYQAALALSRITLKVVLTGNAGCGKSSVLKLLEEEARAARWSGVFTWNADKAVAGLYLPGNDGWRALRSAFGTRFAADDTAGVDKRALFEAMFNDEALRREVNALVHPLVHAEGELFFRRHDFWNNLQQTPELSSLPQLAIAEIPLYFESVAGKGRRNKAGLAADGAWASEPLLIGVHCPQKIRAARLKANRNWPDSMIEKMESWQWEEHKKMQSCDLVADNSGTPEQLRDEVKRILLEIRELYARRLQHIQKALERICLSNAGS